MIIFYYTKDDSIGGGDVGGGGDGGDTPEQGRAIYLIVHHYPELGSTLYEEREEDGLGNIGETVTVAEQQLTGFTFDEKLTKQKYDQQFGNNSAKDNVKNVDGLWTVSGVITSGEDDDENKPLELHLYYTRQKYQYKVQYLDWETKEPLTAIPTKEESALFDSTVTEEAHPIPGYDLYDADEDGNKELTL